MKADIRRGGVQRLAFLAGSRAPSQAFVPKAGSRPLKVHHATTPSWRDFDDVKCCKEDTILLLGLLRCSGLHEADELGRSLNVSDGESFR